jgi:hypothetical protein
MSSTKYLDALILDQQGMVTKDVMDSLKGYCGLFSFIHVICRDNMLDNKAKIKLIDNVINSSLSFLRRKYEADIDLYNKQVTENLKTGKLFESLSVMPAKMREDFELGLEDARNFMYIEIKDILKILNIKLDI